MQKKIPLLDIVGWLVLPSVMGEVRKGAKFLDVVSITNNGTRWYVRCKQNHYIYEVTLGNEALVVKRKGAITGNLHEEINVGKHKAGTYIPNFRYIRRSLVGFCEILF